MFRWETAYNKSVAEREKEKVSCSPKGSNAIKTQFSTVRPVNANRVCIPMNFLKNSTHYSIIININIVIKIILLLR